MAGTRRCDTNIESATVQITASYHQLGTFLDQIEQSDRFITVERISMGYARDEGLPSIRVAPSTLYLPEGL